VDYSPARPLYPTTDPQCGLLTLVSQATQDQEHRLTVAPADCNLCHNCAHATRGAKKNSLFKIEQASKRTTHEALLTVFSVQLPVFSLLEAPEVVASRLLLRNSMHLQIPSALTSPQSPVVCPPMQSPD
jgi:hypothetical protein